MYLTNSTPLLLTGPMCREHVEPNELNKDVFKHVEQPWTFRDIT